MANFDALQYDITSQDGFTLTFNRGSDPSGLGLEFYIDSIDGWDGPNMRQNIMARSGQEGGVIAESFHDHRVMVVNGYCWARNSDDLWVARQYISRCSEMTNADGTIKVYEPSQAGGTKSSIMRRMDKPHMDKNDGTDGFMFQLNMIAPDPRKYATTRTDVSVVAGSNTVTNAGDMTTWPKFVFAGGATITNPITFVRALDGATVKINTNLTTGDTLVVDFLNRTVTKNGVLRYDLVDGTTIWWQLFSGNTTFTSSAACQIQFFSAFG